MECRICAAKVRNLKELRQHFRDSPDCRDELEARAVVRHEHDLGGVEALEDDRAPLTGLAATIYERRGAPAERT
jgi:hypothetical protein